MSSKKDGRESRSKAAAKRSAASVNEVRRQRDTESFKGSLLFSVYVRVCVCACVRACVCVCSTAELQPSGEIF